MDYTEDTGEAWYFIMYDFLEKHVLNFIKNVQLVEMTGIQKKLVARGDAWYF